MHQDSFEVLGMAPADAAHPSLAAGLARAGGIGILDLEFANDDAFAESNFRRLRAATEGRIGLRVSIARLALARNLIADAGERSYTLIYAGTAVEQAEIAAGIAATHRHQVLVELTEARQLDALSFPHHGLVAKGHEAAGWVGPDTSYVLCQKLLGRTAVPVYVQGGVGVHSAAACRAMGAAGVLFDDQLLLLAESHLPEAQQNELARLNGAETRLYGELVDAPCRVYSRPGTAAIKAADEDNRLVEAGELAMADWRTRLVARLGFAGGPELLMPLGQGIGLAATYRSQFRSVGRFVQAVRKASHQHIESAANIGFLAAGGALAKSHGTKYPIAQGPMTRVSDSPEFAFEVAKHGALPFLALALYRGPQVLEMLEQTKARMQQADGTELPWGVGMLGFVPHSLREEQVAAVWKCKPTYALIAGGRPDQAALFEKEGIPTYIHAPAPALLKMYIEQGAKRFVFEGRECGGHIGPLASFPLWEQMIEVLLDAVKPGSEGDYHLLFAGGIHDDRSGAMLAALTAPLAARGMKVGLIMGTAYLFTKEIVDSGAVVEGFRNAAITCDRTVNFETGPGHATRCVATPFFREFQDARKQLLREGASGDELRDRLEDLNMGRMRVASKGLNRDASGQIVTVSVEDQYKDGMFMIGQVATMRDAVTPIAELHENVTSGAVALLRERVAARRGRVEKAKPSDIAIVGVGTLLPKATDAEKYWENILDQVCVIGEVPKDRWDANLYFDADRRARDKVYSRWGGFLDEVAFDPIAFGIPPKSMKAIDPMQLLTLEVARRALADAGMADGDFDRENTSVILGAGGGLGDLGTQYAVRAELPRFVQEPDKTVWERLPEWTEESFAGVLLNVSAGRVANRLDFGGLNFTIDAACASSLAAISIAVNELEAGRSNVAIAGGIDTVQSPFGFLCFSKTQALSPNGRPRTFDQNADGIAISEGLAVIVLKRLADAESAGDRIYAVIKSVAGSSDGKALGLTAPRPEGQKLALKRAYARAGFSAATLGMAEAHGTGTPVGDRAEARTITESLAAEGAAPNSVAISSVKTLLGHTKASAGVSGLIKVALSLYHRVLPAHFGVDKPIDIIADPNAPVYLLKDARPWIAHPDHPRRGGVSAFGFGGTNFHAVLEEYRGGFAAPAASGAARWPYELFLFRAVDAATLATDLGRLVTALRHEALNRSNVRLRDLACTYAAQADARAAAPLALTVVAKDHANLLADLEATIASLAGNGKPLPPSVRLATTLKADAAPKLAFLFPGQGSQYLNMGREAGLYVDEIREALEFADATLRSEFPNLLSRKILPPAAFDAETESAQNKTLTNTRVAQPAIGAIALGYARLAARLGLKPIAAAGHSYGEYAALCAAGVLTPVDFLRLSAVRGRSMAEAAATSERGAMAAVQARREIVTAAIAGIPGVKLANHNSPEQSVISGPAEGVEQAAKALEASGVRVTRLAVSGAFHTELVAGAQKGLSAAIQATTFASPAFTVFSNTTAQPYPTDPAAIAETLDGHLLNSVEFVAEVQAMFDAGARVFVELGPKGACANMAKATLAGKDAVCVSLDGQGGGLRGLLLGLSELIAVGVPVAVSRLFDGRDAKLLDLARLEELVKPRPLPKHAWWVSGGCARPLDDPQFRTGKLPALDTPAIAAARAETRKGIDAEIAAAVSKAVAEIKPVVVTQTVQAPAAPATAIAAAVQSVAPPLGADALVAYQQTMRQFLALQERVITQFLGGQPAAAAPVAGVAFAALPPAIQVPPIPVAAPNAVAPAPPIPAVVPPVAVKPAPIVVPAPVAAAPAFDAPATLLDIVAERTGYPAEMLGLDQDLEAELGIDSIKRVEILGAFQKCLPMAAGDAMQAGMERYTRSRTLNAILANAQADLAKTGTSTPVAVPTAAPSAATAQAVAPAVTPAVDRAALQRALLTIVAERTGYPTDMLGLDQDLEAELGIDSIKRVEILGALQKSLPQAASDAMQAGMERFTKGRTLSTILDAAQAIVPANAVATPTAASVAAPVTAVASLAVGPSRAELQSGLLAIVAERTGYPTDMLGLDQDLEAELGIDSIKRVEILGALQKSLPQAASDAMQAGMERFTKARTLNAILDAASALAPAAAAPTAGAVPAPVAVTISATPVAAAALDRTALQAALLTIVAERTGYPTDMLGLDQDLEAELGIDSIKRVEILGALQKSLPQAASDAMQAGMERFTKARTLSAILDAATTLVPAAAAAATPAPSVAPARPAPAENSDTIPRYVPRARSIPLPTQRHAIAGLYVLTADGEGLAERVADRIVGAGAQAVILPAATAANPPLLASTLDGLRAQHGRIAGIVHLATLATQEADDLAAWRQQTALQAKALFWVIQNAMADLAAADSVVLAASRFGGSLGRDAEGSGLPMAGAAVGLLNCACAEIPGLRGRLVDFEADAALDDMADALLDELAAAEPRTEIGYSGGTRTGWAHRKEALSDHPFAPHLEPAGDWIVLVTGGARGITAEVAEQMARPGMRFVLLGRTPLPGAESAVTAALDNTQALKKALLDAALAQGRRPTPVELDRSLRAVLADREIRSNLARLTRAGAIVDYRACDVRDAETFGALIDEIYATYGQIDAVLHGAGVIEDRRIPDKTPDSFERVYDTKVDSAFVLSRKLQPETLRLLALFTSVAGRFGNAGQSDYAAANETLNRLAWQLHQRWNGVRVIAINWGPWDAGMASEQVKAGFRARGIVPIPVTAGRRWFMDELAYGPRKDVELVAGQGPWEFARAVSPSYGAPTSTSAEARLPLIRQPLRVGAGGAVLFDHVLSLREDPYLGDHRLDGKPVLPAATALEYIAQFVAAGWPEWQVLEIRDLRAFSGIVLEADEVERPLLLRARASTHSEAGMQAVTVELIDAARKSPNYRATVVLGLAVPDAPMADLSPLADGTPLDAQAMYAEHLFHGPQFQTVAAVASMGESGIDATVTASSPKSLLGPLANGANWLFDFGLVDAAPQLALVWARIHRGKTALPSAFASVKRYGREPITGSLRAILRIKPASHEAGIRYDVQFIDGSGRVRIAIVDAEATMSAALNRLAGNS